MDCREARHLMSDYLEQYLVEPEAGLLKEHLADCGGCRMELEGLRDSLRVIRGLPREEPAFDLWMEFAPKFAQIRAEMRPGLLERVRLYFLRLFTALREGWRLFVTAVRYNTGRKLQWILGNAD